jgi:branched-chain amino acid transport system permease protein
VVNVKDSLNDAEVRSSSRARVGSGLGAGAIIVTLPIVIRLAMEASGGVFLAPQPVLNLIPNLRLMMFGALIIFFLVVEPEGLNRLGRNLRNSFRIWSFAY